MAIKTCYSCGKVEFNAHEDEAAHTSPYECVQYLRDRMASVEKQLAALIADDMNDYDKTFLRCGDT